MDVDNETLTPAAESSDAAEHAEARDNSAGATTESPTVTPDAKRETSSDSPDAKKTPRLTDVLKRATETLSKDIVEEGEEAERQQTESSTEKTGTEAEAEASHGAAPKDEGAAAAADRQATEALTALDAQFHTRPEWKKAVEIGGDKIKPVLRQMFGREAQLNERLKRAEPEVQHLAKIRSLTGNNETGFKNLNLLLETFQHNPAGSIPLLERLADDARQRAGLVLQSADLKTEAERIKQQLKDGLIDQEAAEAGGQRLVEIEKARAGQRSAETKLREQGQTQEQQRQQNAQREIVNALNTWEESIRQRHPDLGVLTDLNDPRHGESVMDQVFDLLASKVSVRQPATAAEYAGLAQQCLETVQNRIGRFLPAPRTMRPLSSQSSSATAKVKPRNFQEAEQQARKRLFGG